MDKKMTKNHYSKKAIRSRMLKTGESYSVAARNLANAPLSTGWANLDRALDGGFIGGRIYIFENSFDHQQILNDELLLNLTLPNSQVALITSRTGDEVRSSISGIYRAASLPVKGDAQQSSGDLRENSRKPMDRGQLDAHLKKNLLISTIEPEAHPMNQIAAIEALLEANPRIKVIYTDVIANPSRSRIDVEATARMERELQAIAVRFNLAVAMRLRYSGEFIDNEAREIKIARVSSIVQRSWVTASLDRNAEGVGPVFKIWKNRSGLCSEGLLNDQSV